MNQSELLYKNCEEILRSYFGEKSIGYAQTLYRLGYLYMRKNEIQRAEDSFKQALSIFQKKDHVDAFYCYEYLGDLYHKMKKPRQAVENYVLAFKTLKKRNFPNNSVHIIRLKAKIPVLQRCLLFIKHFHL